MIPSKINEKSMVSIGYAVAVAIAVLSFHAWLNGQFAEIKATLQLIQLDLKQTWTVGQMSTWSYQLKDKNPTLIVPDPIAIANKNP
jgi:hypothetical protein